MQRHSERKPYLSVALVQVSPVQQYLDVLAKSRLLPVTTPRHVSYGNPLNTMSNFSDKRPSLASPANRVPIAADFTELGGLMVTYAVTACTAFGTLVSHEYCLYVDEEQIQRTLSEDQGVVDCVADATENKIVRPVRLSNTEELVPERPMFQLAK